MSTMNVDQGAKAIQTDWETREFLEIISVNMKKLTEFVNKFDLSVRYKLAKVNEKLSNLERQVEYLEGCFASVQQQ